MVAEAGRVDLLVHAAGVMDGHLRAQGVARHVRVGAAHQPHLRLRRRPRRPAGDAGRRADRVPVVELGARARSRARRAYSASKAGLNAFAGALAGEVERDGIAVHVVTTGPVATPMLDDVHFPMRTLGVDDVAQAVVWLDTLPGNVVLPELRLSSVDQGPFAPEAFVPEAARQLGRTELPGA